MIATPTLHNLIDGRPVAPSGELLELVSPVTGEVLAHVLTEGELPPLAEAFSPGRFAAAREELTV